MKKLLIALSLILTASSAFAFELPFEAAIAHQMLLAKEGGIADWKIGDTLNYDMKIKPISVFVTLKASLKVTQNDKDGINIAEELSYTKYKILIDTLIDPETGKIKRTRINGKDQPQSVGAKQGETKIVKEEESHIIVAAFPKAGIDCIHLVTADADGNQTEAWLNPSAVPLSGLLKSVVVQGILTIEMELTSFAVGH
jgi:hypothetical protein